MPHPSTEFCQLTPTSREAIVHSILQHFNDLKLRNLNFARSISGKNNHPINLVRLYLTLDGLSDLADHVSDTTTVEMKAFHEKVHSAYLKSLINDAKYYRDIIQQLEPGDQDAIDSAYLLTMIKCVNLEKELKENHNLALSKDFMDRIVALTTANRKQVKSSIEKYVRNLRCETARELKSFQHALRLLEPIISSELIAFCDYNPMLNVQIPQRRNTTQKLICFVYEKYAEDIVLIYHAMELFAESCPDTKQGKLYANKFLELKEEGFNYLEVVFAQGDQANKNFSVMSLANTPLASRGPTALVNFLDDSPQTLFLRYKKFFSLENRIHALVNDYQVYLKNLAYSEQQLAEKDKLPAGFRERRRNAYNRYRDQVEANESHTEQQLNKQYKQKNTTQTKSLIDKLTPHKALLLSMFADPVPHQVITFAELRRVTEAANGNVSSANGNGSSRKFSLPYYAPTERFFAGKVAEITIHEPHGNAHNNGKVDGNVIKSFRKFLSKANITPSTLWPESVQVRQSSSSQPEG